MKNLFRVLAKNKGRSFAIKIGRNRKGGCKFLKPLLDLYGEIMEEHKTEASKLIPSGSICYFNAVSPMQDFSQVEKDAIFNSIINKGMSTTYNTPRELVDLAKCVSGIISRKMRIKKEDFLVIYEMLTEKSSLLTKDEINDIDMNIHRHFKRDIGLDYNKEANYKPLVTQKDVEDYSKQFIKAMKIDYTPHYRFLIKERENFLGKIFSSNECNIVLAEYEDFNSENLYRAIDLMQKFSPDILALNERPPSKAKSCIMEEIALEAYMSEIQKIGGHKIVDRASSIVSQNVEQIQVVSFNDTLLMQFLELIRSKENPHRARMSCLFYKMTAQKELNHLISTVSPERAEELFKISKYYRLSEIAKWLNVISTDLCPKCGEKFLDPPIIGQPLFAESDISCSFQRGYASRELINLIKEERKFSGKPVKVLVFLTRDDFALYAKQMYKDLQIHSIPEIDTNLKDWGAITKSLEELNKAAKLATAFRLSDELDSYLFEDFSNYSKYQAWKKEFEIDFTFAHKIKQDWEGGRAEHRCYSTKILVDKYSKLIK